MGQHSISGRSSCSFATFGMRHTYLIAARWSFEVRIERIPNNQPLEPIETASDLLSICRRPRTSTNPAVYLLDRDCRSQSVRLARPRGRRAVMTSLQKMRSHRSFLSHPSSWTAPPPQSPSSALACPASSLHTCVFPCCISIAGFYFHVGGGVGTGGRKFRPGSIFWQI